MPSTPPSAAWGRDNSGRQYQRAVHLSPAAAGNPESFLLLSEVLLCCVSEQFLGWLFCFSINFSLPLKNTLLCFVFVDVIPVCTSVPYVCSWCRQGSGKASDPLESEPQVVVSHHVGAEIGRTVSAVNHGASSPNTRAAFGDCFIEFFPLRGLRMPALT